MTQIFVIGPIFRDNIRVMVGFKLPLDLAYKYRLSTCEGIFFYPENRRLGFKFIHTVIVDVVDNCVHFHLYNSCIHFWTFF